MVQPLGTLPKILEIEAMIIFLLHLVFFTSNHLPLVESINLISSSPPSGSLMTLGSKVRLSCSSDSPWFFCLWHSPDGGKQCAIQESSPTSVCTSSPQLVLWGTTRTCGVTIHSITKQDHGDWLCLLSDIQEFETKKQTLNIQASYKIRA